MPKSDFDFTFKFFHPPQRTVPFHKGLLDIRTKRTIAQDRFVVAEQRLLECERRKSTSNIQSLAFEQKQLEKKLASLYNSFKPTAENRPLKMRGRSTSEVIFRNVRRTSSWIETLPMQRAKLSISLQNSDQNLLSLPKIDDISRRFSAYSDGDISDVNEIDSGEENEHLKPFRRVTSLRRATIAKTMMPNISKKQSKPLLPLVAIIPPEDEEILFLTQ